MTVANYKKRASLLAISLVFALTAFAPVIASATPNGNNGTLKVHEYGTPSGTESNDPKVCKFNFEGFGFDNNQTGFININGQGQTNTNYGPFSFGPTNNQGYYATAYFNDNGSNVIANGQYKATLYGKKQNGTIDPNNEKAKSKVFKVECETPKPKFYFQFAKEWAGDEVDLENVKVTFYIGETAWNLGDKPVPVKPNVELSPLSEEVTGLPENCTYESTLPEAYTPFAKPEVDSRLQSIVIEPKVDTLTVTNTVTCEDEGEVLGTTTAAPTTKPPVAALPNTGSTVATVAGILTAVTTGAAMFSSTLRSAIVRFVS